MNELEFVLDSKKAKFGVDNHAILEDVDFRLATAEMCYLTGASGAGKSTFLKTLYGSLPLIGGDVSVVGYELGGLSQKDIPLLRRSLGMVFQEFHLFQNWSVSRNLDYVLRATEWKDRAARQDRIQEVISQVGLDEYLDRPAHTLSGGEQQRLVIARAILNKPKLIIADEPTGNLDARNSDSVMDVLYHIAVSNKTAILLATHDQRLIDQFPARVFQVENGHISEI